jgi:hypothetical protein
MLQSSPCRRSAQSVAKTCLACWYSQDTDTVMTTTVKLIIASFCNAEDPLLSLVTTPDLLRQSCGPSMVTDPHSLPCQARASHIVRLAISALLLPHTIKACTSWCSLGPCTHPYNLKTCLGLDQARQQHRPAQCHMALVVTKGGSCLDS